MMKLLILLAITVAYFILLDLVCRKFDISEPIIFVMAIIAGLLVFLVVVRISCVIAMNTANIANAIRNAIEWLTT